MIDTINRWWKTRVQQDLSTMLILLFTIDMTPFAEDFRAILPWKGWPHLLRLMGLIGIWIRARQVKKDDSK